MDSNDYSLEKITMQDIADIIKENLYKTEDVSVYGFNSQWNGIVFGEYKNGFIYYPYLFPYNNEDNICEKFYDMLQNEFPNVFQYGYSHDIVGGYDYFGITDDNSLMVHFPNLFKNDQEWIRNKVLSDKNSNINRDSKKTTVEKSNALKGFPYHPFTKDVNELLLKIFLDHPDLTAIDLRIWKQNLDNKKKINDKFLSAGLIVDDEYDVFVHPEYGAFFYNTGCSSMQEEIDSFKDIPALDYHCNVPQDELLGYLDMGYKFVIGPSVKIFDYDKRSPLYGVYCTNYNKDLNNDKQANLKH